MIVPKVRWTYVWNDSSGRYQDVLVNTPDKNVFMVIVLDLECHTVCGHRMLNLNRDSGIEVP